MSKSNGCTGFPDGYWRECCEEHDKAYAKGGSRRMRKMADLKFDWCIFVKVSHHTGSIRKARLQSWFMYYGVRIFGSPWCLPLYLWPHWRNHAKWGYGKDN